MPQIEIRPATLGDLTKLVAMEHSYKTNYVWQMDMVDEEGHMGVTFREVRLPRPVKVEYPPSRRRSPRRRPGSPTWWWTPACAGRGLAARWPWPARTGPASTG